MSDLFEKASKQGLVAAKIFDEINKSLAYSKIGPFYKKTKRPPTSEDYFIIPAERFDELENAAAKAIAEYKSCAEDERQRALKEIREAQSDKKYAIETAEREKREHIQRVEAEFQAFINENQREINGVKNFSRIMKERVNQERGKPKRADGWFLLSKNFYYIDPSKYEPFEKVSKYRISTPLDGIVDYETVFVTVKKWLAEVCEIKAVVKAENAKGYFERQTRTIYSNEKRIEAVGDRVFNLRFSTDLRYGNWVVTFEVFEEIAYLSSLPLLNS